MPRIFTPRKKQLKSYFSGVNFKLEIPFRNFKHREGKMVFGTDIKERGATVKIETKQSGVVKYGTHRRSLKVPKASKIKIETK